MSRLALLFCWIFVLIPPRFFGEFLCKNYSVFWQKKCAEIVHIFCRISVPRLALCFCGIFVPKRFHFLLNLCAKIILFSGRLFYEINNIFAHFLCREWLYFLRIFFNQICYKFWCPDWHYFLTNFCVEIGYIFCEFLCQDYCDFLTNFYARIDPIFCRIFVSKMFQFFDDFLCRNCAEITGDRQKPPPYARVQRCTN